MALYLPRKIFWQGGLPARAVTVARGAGTLVKDGTAHPEAWSIEIERSCNRGPPPCRKELHRPHYRAMATRTRRPGSLELPAGHLLDASRDDNRAGLRPPLPAGQPHHRTRHARFVAAAARRSPSGPTA